MKRIDEIRKSGERVDFYIPFMPGELKTLLISQSYLNVDTFHTLRLFLTHLRTFKNRYDKGKLKNYFNRFHNYDDIITEINAKIDDNKEIKNDASPALYKIRMRKRTLYNQIKNELKEILNSASHLFTELNIVERNGRYVLPVKANLKHSLPGIVHAYSNSGETVFIEPMQIVEFGAEVIELEKEEQDEIVNILRTLTSKIKLIIDDIESDIDYAANLDLLFAKVNYALDYNCSMPVFGDHLDIRNGYHPLLKHLKKDTVPLNLNMPTNKKVLLISGPNAGGKTVVLKTVGLLCLMAKFGMFIPADEGTVIPFFDEIYADIGDEQSLESDLSTFAAHLLQIKYALESKNGNNLVLLDELMNQTSVEEGSALASAIMGELAKRKNIVLATTHNESLKIYVSKKNDMINAGMEFTDRPTYRLILGIPQPSNALKLAEQMGLDKAVIENAKSYLDKEKESLNELFESLSKELTVVQEEKERLNRLINEYDSKLADFQSKKKKEMNELKEKYQKELLKAKHRIEELVRTLRKEGPKPEVVKETKEFFKEELKKEESKIPYYPQIGEIVKIKGSNRPGIVLAQHQGRFKIGFDNLFFWAKPEEIEPEVK
uniref:Endonuclease MutS2 n=1 Tax=candidate division WOR-3 bacterium TaxID=2052148 RepID=A0A7V1EGX5_UNCW3